MKLNLLNVIDESFSTYAAMTILDRAIVDVRDGLKPAARQCMYAQVLDKITYKKPFKKSNKSVASAMDHFYVHGDASCYALLTRLAKIYTMRYPLEDFDGSYGTISQSNSEAASRYTEMRLGELGAKLFDNIEKNTITKWFDNYDNTEQFPSVVPSLGFYNICNGSLGIATALSSSIPQFNLREVNEAMIKLLYNPEIDFEEIYCAPDFCTGATILNGDVVKESMRSGSGKAIILRSTVTYDLNENCFYITEIPYGVYAGTICGQIKELVNNGELIGIKDVLDLSTKKANIKILLEKDINTTRLLKELYKKTSLQDSYTINMVMLDGGTRPVQFGWKEALQAHLNHEAEVYKRIHIFEIKKIEDRINIVQGLLKAIANIKEVVEIIQKSKSKDEAKTKLIERFEFNEPQTTAILKMSLSKLINLEIESYKKEEQQLLLEMDSHKKILSSEELQKEEIAKGLKEVMDKYGDERRTKVINLDFTSDDEDAEPIEKKELLIHYTNLGNIYTQESTTLVKTKRGGKGSKIKLSDNEVIVKTINDDNFSSLLLFSNKGKMYSISIDELPINAKVNINQLFEFETDEHPTAITSISRNQSVKYYVFITKNGYIKKTSAEEYILKRGKSIKAINLKDNDEVVNVLFMNEEKVGILTFNGNYVIIDTESVRAIGRATAGVQAIKLSENDYVIDAKIIKDNDKYLITLSEKGLIKKASIEEFPLCSRGIKGKKISDIRESDHIVKFLTLDKDCDIIIIVKRKSIKISTSELRVLSRSATGVKAIEIADNDTASDLIRSQDE